MPRSQSLQIEQPQASEIGGIQFGTQVVAHPVDTYSDIGTDQKMAQLGHMLQAGQDLFGIVDEVDTKKGAEDRALGKPMQQTLMGSYERGWLSLDGTIKADKDAQNLEAAYKTGFDRQGGDIDTWLAQKGQELTQGMQDGPYAASYRATLAHAMGKIREAHSREVGDAVTAKAESNVMDFITDTINRKTSTAQPLDISDITKIKDAFSRSGLGIPDARFNQLTFLALKEQAQQGNYQALSIADQKGPDGSPALSSMPEYKDQIAALKVHAQNVFLTRQEHADKIVQLDYEKRVSASLSPLFIQAQTGDLDGAMSGFSKLVSGGMFAHTPLDIDKYQKALQSISDKSETVAQRELFITAAEGARVGNWTASKIINSGVHPSKIPALLSMMGERHAEERRAMMEDRADAREERKLAIVRQPEYATSVKDVLSAIPELSKEQKALDFSGSKAQALRELRVDAQRELLSFAGQHGTDMGAYQESVMKVRENVRKRADDLMKASKDADMLPAHIRYPNKRDFLRAYESGEFPQDPAQVQEHLNYYAATERKTSK